MQGEIGATGDLKIKVIRANGPGLRWHLSNRLRWGYIWGWIAYNLAKIFSRITKIPTMIGCLSVQLRRANGEVVNYGVVGYRVVTTAFVNFLVDNLQTDTTEFGDFKYHDSGEDNTGEATGDTDMGSTDGIARGTGTQGENAANQYRSIGTLTYADTRGIEEHGLFSQSTGGTLMDRTVFSTINVVASDAIQFTYIITFAAGS